MKLATLKDGSRDGQLAVVSRDLTSAHLATHIAGTLQRVLDDWNFISPQLEDLVATLDGGKARHAFPFDPRQCMSPLPRAFQRLVAAPDGQALAHAASGDFLGPCDDLRPSAAGTATGTGARLQPALAAITGDVAQGVDAGGGLDGIRLLMLIGHWQLPGGAEAATCSAVALTPDALGDAWRAGRAHLRLQVLLRGQPLGMDGLDGLDDTASAMPADLGTLIARAAATRRLRAGSIVCAPLAVALAGALQTGDSLRLDLLASDGQGVFGAIAPTLAGPPAPADGAP